MKTGTHKLALLEVYLLPHLPNSLLSIFQERWLSKRQMSAHQIPCFNLSWLPVARLLGRSDQTSENLPTTSLSGLISGHTAHRITCQVCLTLLRSWTPFHTLCFLHLAINSTWPTASHPFQTWLGQHPLSAANTPKRVCHLLPCFHGN